MLIGAINKNSEDINNLYLDRLKMINEIKDLGYNRVAKYFEENHELYKYLIQFLTDSKNRDKPVVILFFTNGSFDGIIKKLVNRLTS